MVLELNPETKELMQQLLLVLKHKRTRVGAKDIPANFQANGYFIVLFDERIGVASASAEGYVDANQIITAVEALLKKLKKEAQL